MGVPLHPPENDLDAPDASVDEHSDSEPEEWFGTEEVEWQDPSEGAVLSRVLAAAEEGDARRLEALLAELRDATNASVNTRGGEGDTALHLAALYGHEDCVRVLLAAGARADVADEEGALPVHDAAAGGYEPILQMLLDSAPACINAPDAEGDTPLHNAARGQYEDCCRLLLDRGADPSLTNDEFKTPAALAERGTALRQLLDAAAQGWQEQEAAAEGEGGLQQEPSQPSPL